MVDKNKTITNSNISEIKKNLRALQLTVGRYAYEQLRSGKASVHLWRGSTPHNCWVESKSGNTLWHSSDYDRPPMKMFEIVTESKERINHSWIHSDGGHPFESIYSLKPEYLKL